MANKDNTNKNNKNGHGEKAKKPQAKKKKSPQSKTKRFFKYFFLTILILGLVIGVTGLGYVVAVVKSTPDLDVNQILNLSQPSKVFDNKEELIDALKSTEERDIITIDKMPKNLLNAYISIEDERFEEHHGIDFRRIAGAVYGDVKFLLTGHGAPQGASTLTQQLIKNSILLQEASSENHYLDSINRKIKEINLALQLEKKMTKDQILEAYLNTIPLGGTIYGVEAAALYYFDKHAEDLSLIECAYIAGVTQAPSYYSAYNTEEDGYPNTYLDRTKTVLLKMKELGKITEEEYNDAYAQVDQNQFAFKSAEIDHRMAYEWFVSPALKQVRADLKDTYKYTDDEVTKLFLNGGLKIYTTMDRKIQDGVQAVMDDRSNYNYDWGTNPGDAKDAEGVSILQAATTVMDYRTGHVIAMIGGRGEQPAGSVNRAYTELKPIASTTKPLTVYGPAIDTKKITAATPLDDAPLESDLGARTGYPNGINNWNKVFDGLITARDAIAFSKNVTSVRTVDMMGLNTALDYGQRAGILYNDVSKSSMAALALGQHDNSNGSDGANTTIMASAFGSFGNNGVRTEPVLYTKVEDANGKVILNKEAKTTDVFSPQTAYIMYNILKEPLVRFDAGGAKFGNIPVSGKTGTTSDSDHFWFCGLTPYYSASVWIGHDNPQTMVGTSSGAATLWGKVMAVVHEGLDYKEIEQPSGLVTRRICIDSGKLAGDLCGKDERGNRVRTEYFIAGTEPTTTCDVHVEAEVNSANNKLATDNTPDSLRVKKVFIKKPNASKTAADYKYVLPTEKDDTKPVETINLSQIGLYEGMDLFDAVSILKSAGVKYTLKGDTVPSSIKKGAFELVDFDDEIEKGQTATITVQITKQDTPSDSDNGDDGNDGNEESDTPTE